MTIRTQGLPAWIKATVISAPCLSWGLGDSVWGSRRSFLKSPHKVRASSPSILCVPSIHCDSVCLHRHLDLYLHYYLWKDKQKMFIWTDSMWLHEQLTLFMNQKERSHSVQLLNIDCGVLFGVFLGVSEGCKPCFAHEIAIQRQLTSVTMVSFLCV